MAAVRVTWLAWPLAGDQAQALASGMSGRERSIFGADTGGAVKAG